MALKKKAGAPTNHNKSARRGQPATPTIVPQVQELYPEPRQHRAACRDEELRRNFRTGFLLGLAIGLVILCAVLFLWAVPTVDGCVQSLKELQGAVA